MTERVSYTAEHNLCISCGICAAVCPAHCITFREHGGMRLPCISEPDCLMCGRCFTVCPGKGFDYGSVSWFGLDNAKYICTARTRDPDILANAVSGGVVTELIARILSRGEYTSAFVLRGYDCAKAPETEIIHTPSELEDSQKSRYVIVSHQKCAEYLLAHPDEKVILVGTGCFVHGLLNMIAECGLKRENYFIIGLFCDRTMSLNVLRYFEHHPAVKSSLREIYFRTKDAGGWPGDVRLVESDGRITDLPNTERMKVKDYFQPERCLYCLDKLNVFADISVGDNYTGRNSDIRGSSSVIIRTDEGMRVWREHQDKFEVHEAGSEEIYTSQHLKQREDNYHFAKLKEAETGRAINITATDLESRDIRKELNKRLRAVRLGSDYSAHPGAIQADIRRKKLKAFAVRVLRKIKRCLWH